MNKLVVTYISNIYNHLYDLHSWDWMPTEQFKLPFEITTKDNIPSLKGNASSSQDNGTDKIQYNFNFFPCIVPLNSCNNNEQNILAVCDS